MGSHRETLNWYLACKRLWKQIIVPHVPSSIGAPSKEGELCCYECGQKGHIKPQCPKLKGKQRVARAQIENLVEEDEESSETPMNRASKDALYEATYPQEGEDDLKNNSGDEEEDQPQN